MLLVEVTPPADLMPGKPVTLAGKLSYLVCERECVPGTADLRLSLPVFVTPPGAVPKPVWSLRIEQGAARLVLVNDGGAHLQVRRIVLHASGRPTPTLGDGTADEPDLAPSTARSTTPDGRLP